MKLADIRVGDIHRYTMSEERDPDERYVWVSRWMWVKVEHVSPETGRVTIRSYHHPQECARSVKRYQLW